MYLAVIQSIHHFYLDELIGPNKLHSTQHTFIVHIKCGQLIHVLRNDRRIQANIQLLSNLVINYIELLKVGFN